jgi:hypothetical protein
MQARTPLHGLNRTEAVCPQGDLLAPFVVVACTGPETLIGKDTEGVDDPLADTRGRIVDDL